MTNKPRVTISIDSRLDKRIEDFQKEYGFATKSGAIQELLRLGVAAIKEEQREEGKNGK